MEQYKQQDLLDFTAIKERLKKVNPMTSLASFPNNISVYGLDKDEYILLFIRKHKVILLFNYLLYTVVLLLPIFIRLMVNLFNHLFLNDSYNTGPFFNSKYWITIMFVWLAYVIRGYFNIFFKWYYDINILTTNRFVDVDLVGIFKIRIEETAILSIEDVKDVQANIFDSIFNMGYLEVYTASGETVFNLSNVPSSTKIRDFIMDVVSAERKKYGEIK